MVQSFKGFHFLVFSWWSGLTMVNLHEYGHKIVTINFSCQEINILIEAPYHTLRPLNSFAVYIPLNRTVLFDMQLWNATSVNELELHQFIEKLSHKCFLFHLFWRGTLACKNLDFFHQSWMKGETISTHGLNLLLLQVMCGLWQENSKVFSFRGDSNWLGFNKVCSV